MVKYHSLIRKRQLLERLAFYRTNPIKSDTAMQKILGKFLSILFIIFPLFLLTCSGPRTDEDLIREMMDDIGSLAEKKDLNSLMEYITEDYSDYRGRDKAQTRDLVESHFQQFRGIVIHILSTRIDRIQQTQAFIQTDVALSSGAARVFRKLARISTDNYRFKITLTKKKGRWLIRCADWKAIGLHQLFPESLSLLKKLFPDT